MSKTRIAIGCDHAGYEFKDAIKKHLLDKGYEVTDHGTHGPDSVDYPDFVHPVAKDIIDNHAAFGILICGSGNGVAITANKYEDIRCGLAWNVEVAKLVKQHNNANILAMPARFITADEGKNLVNAYLEETFEGGRHQRRVNKMNPNSSYYC